MLEDAQSKSNDNDTIEEKQVSRKKFLASIGVTGAALLAGSLLPAGFAVAADQGTTNFTGTVQVNAPAASTTSSMNISRDANYSGGSPGYVNSALYVVDTVRNGVTAFEWGITSVLNNFASAGENVALYGQGNRHGTGPTWAGVFEARDHTQTAGTTGLLGLEVDVFANGQDTNQIRFGIDIVVGKGVAAGSTCQAYAGIRLGPVNGDSNQGSFKKGLLLTGNVTTGVDVQSNGTYAFRSSGTNNVGLDLSTGTHSDSAIRIKANDSIALEASNMIKMKYNASTQKIEFYNGSNRIGYIDTNGADHAL
ncbi:hypothetical protein Back11_59520 [Paenibacillus baekrokdamisoli]|uniref:Uncharacterized protein n=1 Tax=Paenibacillus baekrokdamisoli TaxID=1712516 RepID=A0A3G9J092_9BACL|nr:hypothetical protein [Paenibacillus baekrokdamisoli]MBB3071357.1 hypothetical protein [Paenibacillus baekrokdamisoli]BBH24607.1 hypothetical protein Back11_59520 [Paenibacillus baekrokdamisoli]